MADEEDHGMTPDELADRVWHFAEKIRFCMFATWDGRRQRMRPLSSIPTRDEHAIYFLVDAAGDKNEQIQRFPFVSLGYADPGAGDYVTITGRATVGNDRAKIKELWTPFAKAWWDSADDPDILLVRFVPDEAELWEGPHKLVAAAIMLTAAVTGSKPSLGDHGNVGL